MELFSLLLRFFNTRNQPKTTLASPPLFAGSASNKTHAAAVYLDLAYLPSGFAASMVDVEFFRRVRSSCYIISGEELYKNSVMRPILESLLEGKAAWADIQVSYGSTCAYNKRMCLTVHFTQLLNCPVTKKKKSRGSFCMMF